MTTYHLEVYGWAWGGFRGVYQYTLDKATADAILAGERDPNSVCGDFASLLDWRLVRETNEYEATRSITRRIDTFKTLRGFRNGMRPQRFYRLANGY